MGEHWQTPAWQRDSPSSLPTHSSSEKQRAPMGRIARRLVERYLRLETYCS